jgi:RNA recognition motif-containing protein
MFTKLFVGALPFEYSDEELKALFESVGAVRSAKMVPDPDRGRTRGFGFVEMSTPELAQAAIDQLNGKPMGEKKIFVTEARERASKAPGANPKFPAKPFRKAGRNDRAMPGAGGISNDFPRGQYSSEGGRPSWPPTPRGDRPFSKPPRRYKGRNPMDRSGPGSSPGYSGGTGAGQGFGPKRSGFSRPNKWEPRGDDKRSFGAPRKERGDFGPSRPNKWQPRGDDKRSLGSPRNERSNDRSSRPTDSPPKKEFWRKFDKKRKPNNG